VDEMEELLTRYRPVGPPADLRARVTGTGGGQDARGSIAGWLLVVAALFCAVLFYSLAAREHQRMVMRIPAPVADPPPDRMVEPWP
jgi:hypothetical protein